MTKRRPGAVVIIKGSMAVSFDIESPSAAAATAFVGRERELASFGSAFAQALEGRRQVLTLAGEPGIGKTRLAEAFADEAEDRGALVLWGRCYEEPGAPPYWPWVQILREFIDALSPSELSQLAGAGGREIVALVPELGVALGSAEERNAAPLEPSQARFRTFDAIGGFLRRAAAQVPLVLLIDNVHWADKASLALLEFLSQELIHARVVIVCTYRDTEITRTNPLLGTLGALGGGEGIARLKLRGLESQAISLLAETLLGRQLPTSIVRAIDHQTDGNPLFVIELLKILIEESRDSGIEPIAVRIPDGVRETIGRRLSRLPEQVNSLLRTASVIGRSFESTVLARIADMRIETVLDALHLAERAGFVEGVDRSSQACRFTHALIRETLYDEIPTTERLSLHGLAADALVALYPDKAQSRLSRIAHHYFESAALGHASQAADYAARAANEAMRLDAYDDAATHWGNALAVLRQHGLSGDERVRNAMYGRIRALTCIGNMDAAMALIAEAVEDPNLSQDDAWLTDILTQRSIVTSYGIQAEQLPLLQRLLERLPRDDNPARAKALAAIAFAERTLGRFAGVRPLVEEALAMARRIGDADVLSHCMRSALLALRGDPADLGLRLALGEEFLGVAPSVDNAERTAEALYHHACNLIEAGRIDATERLLEGFDRIQAFRYGYAEYRAQALPIVLALLRGEYSELEARIEDLRDVGHKTRGEDADGVYGVQMFMLKRDLGELGQLAPVIEQFAASPINRAWTPGLMLALTEVGRLDRAARELERLAADDFADIPVDDLYVPTLIYCAEASTALGHAECAQALYARLLPFAATFASHHLAVCFGSTERYLGMLAATLGDSSAATRHFEAALRANAQARAWPWLARTCFDYARLLRSRGGDGDQERADELLRESEQLAERLGMRGLADAIGSLLRGQQAGADYPDDLTAREVDVLRLIAIGRSNKDIAKVLAISLNTVATHVRNILTKTDCANRTEAAAYANRHGLVEPD